MKLGDRRLMSYSLWWKIIISYSRSTFKSVLWPRIKKRTDQLEVRYCISITNTFSTRSFPESFGRYPPREMWRKEGERPESSGLLTTETDGDLYRQTWNSTWFYKSGSEGATWWVEFGQKYVKLMDLMTALVGRIMPTPQIHALNWNLYTCQPMWCKSLTECE